ncbi:hypothetical protein ACKKBG_A21305 [Auxenochlorella protothecoides x Auxenochlorella symbiontica]
MMRLASRCWSRVGERGLSTGQLQVALEPLDGSIFMLTLNRPDARNAQFAFPETRLGIIPGAGGTQRLPRVVGTPRAKELIYTGRRISAQEALDIGLADHLADSVSAEDRALRLARDIAQGGPVALRMAKQAIGLGMEVDLASGLLVEEACYAQVIPTQDRLEGLKAFAEKRPPVFKGE